MFNRYEYENIRNAAIAAGATQEDITALGEWFELYGMEHWNGEYFDADGYKVYRIEEYDEDNDVYSIVGYEIQ